MMHKDAGFTLIETLIALLVVAVLSSLAHAAFSRAVAKTRMAETHARLQESITASMRKAVISSRIIVMCPSQDGVSCSGGSDWTHGWISFEDGSGNRLPGPDNPQTHQQPAAPDGIGLTGSPGRPRLVFRPSGTNPGTNATFTICDRRGKASGTSLVLANNGRLRRQAAAPEASDKCRAAS